MPAAKAGAQCRVPVPSPPPCHGGRRGRWGQARLVGAGEAGGGRRGWWGQARLVGAASHRPHARARQHRTLGKPPGQIPSQHWDLMRTGSGGSAREQGGGSNPSNRSITSLRTCPTITRNPSTYCRPTLYKRVSNLTKNWWRYWGAGGGRTGC